MPERSDGMRKTKPRIKTKREVKYTAADLADVENPPLTDEELSRLRPAREVIPDVLKLVRRFRGRQKAPTKRLISLRLDPDVVDHFRARGPGWQARINSTLRKAVGLS
jgi:uncharacterized protein (DUF4415 family)